jgi:hypothetical protein
MLYFLHKYKITQTVMRLGSLEPVYDIYLYKLYYNVYIFMQCSTPHKNLAYHSMVDASPGLSIKTLSFEHKTLQL